MSSINEIQNLLTQEFPDNFLCTVTDESDGCGSKFRVILVSDSFQGMGLLDRQRKVNQVLKAPIEKIHALTLKTWTVADYEKKKHEL